MAWKVFERELKVYPNSSNDRITIEYDHTDDLVIEITDLLGKKFFSAKYIDQGSISIDVKNYKPGIYFYYIESKNESYKGKFIVK